MDAYLMLALAEGGDPAPVAALLDAACDPASLLRSPEAIADLPPRVLRRLADPDLAAAAARARTAAARFGQTILTPADADYPDAWREAPLRPLALFVRGSVQALTARPAVAFVGSRTPTPYGSEAADGLAAALARAKVCLWSGLARGVDGAGHRACVAARTPTVAVLAGGLDGIYPPEHTELADAIVAGGGCLISELPPGRRATRGHFPRRNRLLAMGTPAVVVIEAGLASGALQTARLAAEWGASVHALPGPWRSERSQGCHRLLHEGADVIESPETLLRDLGVGNANDGPAALRLVRSADETAILRQLDEGPRPCGLVQRESGLDREAFYRALFALETAGIVRHGAGDLLAFAPSAGDERPSAQPGTSAEPRNR